MAHYDCNNCGAYMGFGWGDCSSCTPKEYLDLREKLQADVANAKQKWDNTRSLQLEFTKDGYVESCVKRIRKQLKVYEDAHKIEQKMESELRREYINNQSNIQKIKEKHETKIKKTMERLNEI